MAAPVAPPSPSFRAVSYVEHVPKAEILRENYVTLECVPEGGVQHAVTVPKVWTRVAPLPIDPDPAAPALGALIIEDPRLGPESAVIVTGSVPVGWADSATAVVSRLGSRDGLDPYRWNDEDAAVGGARAMVGGGDRIGAIRVLPLAAGGDPDDDEGVPGYVFVAIIGPRDRLEHYATALQHALLSLKVHPAAKWAT